MTRVTIDLDRLRATMPAHPTWPTAYDTTDDTEREDCWRRLSQWLETALCDPESDNDGQHGATTPLEPETGTQRPWPPPTPDMHESERGYHLAPCLHGCSSSAWECADHPGGAAEFQVAVTWVNQELYA